MKANRGDNCLWLNGSKSSKVKIKDFAGREVIYKVDKYGDTYERNRKRAT